MSDTVKALWVGYPGEGTDRSVLTPGETVREIPRAEAEASDNWRIVTAQAAPALTASEPVATPGQATNPTTGGGSTTPIPATKPAQKPPKPTKKGDG